MAFGRTSNVESQPGKAPLLGSFPLDHDGDCTQFMKAYVQCLKENKNNNGKCRELSKAYLQCRMDNGLMDKDDMKNLGFADLENSEKKTKSN